MAGPHYEYEDCTGNGVSAISLFLELIATAFAAKGTANDSITTETRCRPIVDSLELHYVTKAIRKSSFSPISNDTVE